MLDDDWTFDAGFPGATGDRLLILPLHFAQHLNLPANPKVSCCVTTPILRDRQYETIVSNESSGAGPPPRNHEIDLLYPLWIACRRNIHLASLKVGFQALDSTEQIAALDGSASSSL
nr:hypothetical protein [uncultured bacterium]